MLKKLVKENKSRLLVVWNRGLGDIPLGLYAFCQRVRELIPHASITVLTRPNLEQGFAMLSGVTTLIASHWQRGKSISVRDALEQHQLASNMFDTVFEWIDITRWLRWQLGKVTPKLLWKKEWDALSDKFELAPVQRVLPSGKMGQNSGLGHDDAYIAVQVQTETSAFYDRNRDWPLSSWRDLFYRIISEQKKKVILLGLRQSPVFLIDGVIDLRGKTSVLEMMAVIKNHCRALVAPDSGVVAMTYFLNQQFPIRLVSLWGSPNWGVLRQNVASPNPQLTHIPLMGAQRDVTQISVDTVYEALFCKSNTP
ncbi:MAG: hypothetical protein AAF443_05500 [Chlamydiota bacterium]